jgi:membrane-associated protease RseP (regulator of RpoE activity)
MLKIKSLVLAAMLLPAVAIASPDQNQDPQQQQQQDQDDQGQYRAPSTGTVEVDSYQWSAGKGRLGVILMGLTPELRGFFGAPRNSGLLVAGVAPQSPAYRAGIRVGDVITRIEGQQVQSVEDITDAINNQGQNMHRVMIEVIRDHRPLNLRAQVMLSGQNMQSQQNTQNPSYQQQQNQGMQQQPNNM